VPEPGGNQGVEAMSSTRKTSDTPAKRKSKKAAGATETTTKKPRVTAQTTPRTRKSSAAGGAADRSRKRGSSGETAERSRKSRKPAVAKAAPAQATIEVPARKRPDADSEWTRALAAAQQRREQSPSSDNTDLFKHLLRDKCLRAGTVGSLTSATALIPGLSRLAGLAIDGVGDLAYMVRLQRELALTTFAIYGREPTPKELDMIGRWILSFGAGGSELVEQVGKMIARQLAKNLAGRLIKRGLPFAEIAYSAVTHLAGTYLVGRRAQLYCIGLSDAEAEILLESERGIKLQARRIKMLTAESLAMVEERFGTPARTLADLFRRFTGTGQSGDKE
jgi:hypothetical protein